MASFTDQISQFNPYISQLPVEAMKQVGMYKQQQYDAGVQKIQGYIDNIAGINVSRPVDKEHVQSKLDELNSRLRTVAAGDFSNSQLVNSVGGMATSIIKDPFIQAAVYSTSNDSKQSSQMDADDKEGKLTPHARYNYERQRNAYLNNPNLKTEDGKPITFTGRYTRSWDLDKNMQEAIKNVGDATWTSQKVFKTDDKGNYIYEQVPITDAKGKPIKKDGKIQYTQGAPILSEYAVEEKKAGRFPAALQSAIDEVLNRPEAQQELAMRGIYNYRGFDDVNDFVEQYNKVRDKGVTLLQNNELELKAKLATETDPEKKKQLEVAISAVNNKITNLKNVTEAQITEAKGYSTLDGYKAALETQSVRNRFMESGNNLSESKTYVENIPWKAHQSAIKDERDWYMDQQNLRVAQMRAATDAGQLTLAQEKWKYDPTNPANPINQGKPFEGAASPHGLYSNFIDEGSALELSHSKNIKELVTQYMLAINPNNTDAQTRKSIGEWSEKDPTFLTRWYEKAKQDLNEHPNNLAFSKLKTLLPQVQQTEIELGDYTTRLNQLNQEANAKLGKQALDLSDLEKGLKPVTYTYDAAGMFETARPKTIMLSAKDQLNFAMYQSGAFLSKNEVFKDPAKVAMIEAAGKAFEASTGISPSEFSKKVHHFSFSGTGSFEKEFLETQGRLSEKIHNKFFENTITTKEAILKEHTKGNSPVSFDLYPPNVDSKTKETIDRNLTNVLNEFKAAGADVSKFESYQAPGKGEANKYSVSIGVDRSVPGMPLTLDLYDGKSLVQQLPIDGRKANEITGRSLQIPAPVSKVAQKINWNSTGDNMTNSTNDITSNPHAVNAYKGAYYKSSQFKALGIPELVGGDVFKDYEGKYTPYFYIKSNDGRISAVPVKFTSTTDPVAYNSADAAEAVIRSLSSRAQFDEIIKNAK